MEPYRMARLTTFLDPAADAAGAGFQSTQASIALGSGGIFGVGLGESVQKAFYLPESHTDMIAAVIGEELGLFGISMLVGLYMLLGYAGFRTAQRARDRYGRLLAAALTAMILVQASINLFAVLGLAPLTGVTLPFVSYGNSSLIVTLAAVGLLLNIAAGGTASMPARTARPSARGNLRVLDGGGARQPARRTGGARAAGGDRSRRDRGARGAGAGRRRRAR
jgi:cell division protein FtsW